MAEGKLKPDHQCTLPQEEDIIVRYIDSGWFVYCRRKFRTFMTVSGNHPSSKAFLKSTAAIRLEKARHLQYYYFVIHPFSLGRMYWQFFMMFVLVFALVIMPINFAADLSQMSIRLVKLTFDLMCCVDICVTFSTGYYHPNTKKVILQPKKIIKNYLCSYFLSDLFSSVPIFFTATSFGYKESMPMLELVVFLKTMRLITLLKYLDTFRDWKGYSIYKFKIFKLVLFVMIMLLWCSSVNYVIAKHHPGSWLRPELNQSLFAGLSHACFKTLYVFLLVGYSDTPSTSVPIKVLQICGLQVGFIFKLYFLAQVVQILYKYNSSGNKYEQHMKQVDEYVRYKGLPDSMKQRMVRYFDFRYQKHFVKENEILSVITSQLRQEIMLHACQEFLERVEYFQDLPLSILVRIVSCLKAVIVLPNDVIIRAGVAGDTMYFISFGTVAVYTSQGKEICHLGDGAYFGEIALVIENEKRVASVVAVDSCELLELNRQDFQTAIEPYPEYYMRLKKLAQSRLKGASSVISEFDESDKSEPETVKIKTIIEEDEELSD